MNLFDTLVDAALGARPSLASLRPVVEKEILHHDILREMSTAGFLDSLTFIGGTCLRDCYGSQRLSEDLDFSGGTKFDRSTLSSLGNTIVTGLFRKYGLEVSVSEPIRETGNVDTWKIRIITSPGKTHLPAQRINIDVCAIMSHDRKPAMVQNHYQIDLGTSGLILHAESREEILADKVVALALRPNRVKNRDLWDILWLTQQGIVLDPVLVLRKLEERSISQKDFIELLQGRVEGLAGAFKDYAFELMRFLPKTPGQGTIEQPGYWDVMLSVLRPIPIVLSKRL